MGKLYVIEHGESCPIMPYYVAKRGGWRRGLKTAKTFEDRAPQRGDGFTARWRPVPASGTARIAPSRHGTRNNRV